MFQISKRILSIAEVKDALAKLKYAIENNPRFKIVVTREKDTRKELQYTNQYTLSNLFPNESPVEALRRELKQLKIEEYLKSVVDDKFQEKLLHIFIREYDEKQVYIKFRAELLSHTTNGSLLVVISFHFAEYMVERNDFPYIGRSQYE